MAPLERQVASGSDWQCCTCCEDYEKEHEPWQTDAGELVCEDCIRAQFDKALKYDSYWPARWGFEQLFVRDYASFLTAELMSEYIVQGAKIMAYRRDAEPQVLEGRTPGRDYQICPECKATVLLRDGCNHISCVCGASFCFICGHTAFDDGSGHWNEGAGCPRYNAVGSGQELYDEDDAELTEDEDESQSDGENIYGEDGRYTDTEENPDEGSDEESDEEGNDGLAFDRVSFGIDVSDGALVEPVTTEREASSVLERDEGDRTPQNLAFYQLINGQTRTWALPSYIDAALGTASHDFIVAMQRSDPQTQAKLRRFLETSPLQISIMERNEILDIMLSARLASPDDAIIQWIVYYNGRHTHIYELLLDFILATHGEPRGKEQPFYFQVDHLNTSSAQSLPLLRQDAPYNFAVLHAPIAGLFDFQWPQHRLQACIWLRARAAATGPSHKFFDCAIFDRHAGPGHSDVYGKVSLVETMLPGKVFVLETNIVTFERMNYGVFVQRRPRCDPKTDLYALNRVRGGNLDDLCSLLDRYESVKPDFTMVGLTEALERGQRQITNYLRPI